MKDRKKDEFVTVWQVIGIISAVVLHFDVKIPAIFAQR
jgi:hypothetical protein